MIKHWEFNNEGWRRIIYDMSTLMVCTNCKKITPCGWEDRDTFLCDECYLDAGKLIDSFE